MLYQDQSDENLVMLTLAGEQCAYEVLVRRYEKMVMAVAKGITGNQFLAEDGSALDLGDQWMFGHIKLIKGKNVIELPDGKREPILNAYFFDVRKSYPYYALTMPRGWEWFNDVRDEERYKEFVERARELADGNN